MANLVLPKPKEKHWITYIKQRIKKNKNFLGFISGQTGSGKSMCSLRIAEELDPEFSIDRIVFNGIELMDLINSDKLKKGSVIVFEEAGVEMNNKNWASVTNKMLNYLLQTFRHRCFILIFNSPYMDYIDASSRKLFHAEMQTLGINFNKKTCKLKPQLIQYNGRMQKFYYKRLKVITEKGCVPIDYWNIDLPSKELRDSYEKKKREFTDKLNKKIYDELSELNNKSKGKKELTDIQKEILECLKKGMNVERIATIRGKDKDVIYSSMRLIKKKGYEFKPIKEGSKIISYEVLEI